MQEDFSYTIIIPHYNSPEMLQKLISTIPLEKRDIQIIVVDDRSEKGLEELSGIRKKYKGRIEFYRNNHGKKGAGTARNIGLKYARGKWLIFADADDYFTDNIYEKVSRYVNSDSDIIYFRPDSIYLESGEQSNRHTRMAGLVLDYIKDKSAENEVKIRYEYIQPVSKMIRRSIVQDNDIHFSEIPAGNDMWFSTQTAFFANKIDACDEQIYMITRGPNSITTNTDKEAFSCRMKECLKYLKFLKRILSKQDWKKIKYWMSWLFTDSAKRGYGLLYFLKWFVIYFNNGIIVINREHLKIIEEAIKEHWIYEFNKSVHEIRLFIIG